MNAHPQTCAPPLFLASGQGVAHGHHGEILQGALRPGQGTPIDCLVTLPCIEYQSVATFLPRYLDPLIVIPNNRHKARRAASLTLAHLGFQDVGGILLLSGNIPTRQGLGSSTADVVAAIRAVADALGRRLSPGRIARLAVAAETAADPLMFGTSALLFAQREGRVIERFARPLPPMEILGIRDPANGTGQDTLEGAPRCYDKGELREFEALRAGLATAIAHGDDAAIGAIATRSARLNQRFLYKSNLDRLAALGQAHGALGIQVAHSGTAMGLIFRPLDRDALWDMGKRLRAGSWGLATYHIPVASIVPPSGPASNADKRLGMNTLPNFHHDE